MPIIDKKNQQSNKVISMSSISSDSSSPLLQSLESICGKTDQVMVYGYSDCMYEEISKILEKSMPVYDFNVGATRTITREKRTIEQIASVPSDEYGLTEPFKPGLTNLVFENFKRKKENLKIIPILFCVDMIGNKFDYNSNSKFITSRDSGCTNSELRRAYKLCHEFQDSELSQVALNTFKFVKICKNKSVEVCKNTEIKQVKAPWELDGWDSGWRERILNSTKTLDQRSKGWRGELRTAILNYNIFSWEKMVDTGAYFNENYFLTKTSLV